ncbi:uncharacterized protein K441DRAFT_362444 [Cenococcum geophilum 1.58]|uniref:uncharacterized protein n=1 Tax=Cenococcum geophilum 1.58 TaxID=794803 RepID=UPI00358E2441|nr:hypothetical protein K441DRAFT_362444 [Cenococcum geophilum 1.58]
MLAGLKRMAGWLTARLNCNTLQPFCCTFSKPLHYPGLRRSSNHKLLTSRAVVLLRTQRRTQQCDELKFRKSDDAVLLITVNLVIFGYRK